MIVKTCGVIQQHLRVKTFRPILRIFRGARCKLECVPLATGRATWGESLSWLGPRTGPFIIGDEVGRGPVTLGPATTGRI